MNASPPSQQIDFSFLESLAQQVLPAEHHPMLAYVFQGGKHVRPWLMHRICEQLRVDPEPLWGAMAGVELIHAASLIHDDMVDHDALRRDKNSFPSQFGQELGILYGDYFFLAALQLFSDKKFPPTILHRVIATVREMTNSQIMEASGQVDNLEAYNQYILGKTARLFGLCASIPLDYYKMSHPPLVCFAEAYGMAFQVADDLSEDKDEINLQRFIGKEAAANRFQEQLAELDAFHFIPSQELPFIRATHAPARK